MVYVHARYHICHISALVLMQMHLYLSGALATVSARHYDIVLRLSLIKICLFHMVNVKESNAKFQAQNNL